jgi:hypothetical protein
LSSFLWLFFFSLRIFLNWYFFLFHLSTLNWFWVELFDWVRV